MADKGTDEGNVSISKTPASLIDKIADNWSQEYDALPVDAVKDDNAATTEEEPESNSEEVKGGPEADTEEVHVRDKVQERIDELVAKQKTAEEEAKSWKSKVEELEAKGKEKEYILTPTKESPLSDVMSIEDLQKREALIEHVRDTCLRNPGGYTVTDSNGKEVFYDAKDVREALVETDKLLRKDVPARAKWLETHQAENLRAKQEFPWMFDARREEYQIRQNVLRNFPEIRKLPQYESLIGLLILGEKTLNESKSNTKKVTAKPAEVKKVPTPPSQSSTSTTTTKDTPRTSAKLPKNPNRSQAVNFIMDTVLKNYNIQ
jgi:hypothetical protein